MDWKWRKNKKDFWFSRPYFSALLSSIFKQNAQHSKCMLTYILAYLVPIHIPTLSSLGLLVLMMENSAWPDGFRCCLACSGVCLCVWKFQKSISGGRPYGQWISTPLESICRYSKRLVHILYYSTLWLILICSAL